MAIPPVVETAASMLRARSAITAGCPDPPVQGQERIERRPRTTPPGNGRAMDFAEDEGEWYDSKCFEDPRAAPGHL